MTDWLHDMLNREPDYIAPPQQVFDVSHLGVTIGDGVPITQMNTNLRNDLESAGCHDGAEFRAALYHFAQIAVDTTEPGDVGYPIYAACNVEYGGKVFDKVWIQQFTPHAAAIYYARDY